jgi:hypothetical protein
MGKSDVCHVVLWRLWLEGKAKDELASKTLSFQFARCNRVRGIMGSRD